MSYGISELAVVPVRRENKEQSEQLTQILFGETFQIIDMQKEWSLVKLTYDGYEGWINSDTITHLHQDEYSYAENSKKHYTHKLSTKIKNISNNEIINLSFGCTIPNLNLETGIFKIRNKEYLYTDDLIKNPSFDLTALAHQFLNAPYLWGGKNPWGIDCSGFTQLIFKVLNYKLPRDAKDQIKCGDIVNFIGDIKTGDLAFFDNSEGEITHVGIILNPNKIIHSSVKVRIDQIDQHGIFNKEKQKYTHKLRIVKRIIK